MNSHRRVLRSSLSLREIDIGILAFGHEVKLTKAIEMSGDKHVIGRNIEPGIIQERPWQEVYKQYKNAILEPRIAPAATFSWRDARCRSRHRPTNFYAMRKATMD